MKIKILFFAVCFVLKASFVLAQQAVIIKIEGSVEVRIDAVSAWQTAVEGQQLQVQSQVKTGPTGKVIIAFGQDQSNIITIEKNTETVIEQIKPGAVYLPKGRVFTIIRDLTQIENFEIKTPTAIAGARGTGWVTEVVDGRTEISVFEDIVAVRGFDENGKETAQFDIRQDFSTSISPEGQYEQPEPIAPELKEELHKISMEIIKAVEEFQPPPPDAKGPPPTSQGPRPEGPMPPQDMARLLEAMKQSGEYSEQEIADMEQMFLNGVGPQNPDEMFKIMGLMAEMGMLTPEEQGMMAEISENQEIMRNMSPEEREQYIRSLEEKYGVQHNAPGGDQYRTEFSSAGEYRQMPPAGDLMHQEIMANSGMIDQMSPEERQAYFAQMEQKYGLEPFRPDGEMHQSGEFNTYMDQFQTHQSGPYPGAYDYSGDPYFGEFDQHWDSASGTFVTNPYGTFYDPLQDNINDLPLCSCACTGPNCGLNCKPVYCGSSNSN